MENKTKGYLYSMKTGELTVRAGYVVPHPAYGKCRHVRYSGKFYVDGDENKVIQCDIKPEVVYHDVLWLEDWDNNFAKDLFVLHELAFIEELKEQIHKHEEKIETIRKGIS